MEAALSILQENLRLPSIFLNAQVAQVEEASSWMTSIIRYLEDGTLPSDLQERKKLSWEATYYTRIDNQLYRRRFLQPPLKCLSPNRAEYVMKEIHEGCYVIT